MTLDKLPNVPNNPDDQKKMSGRQAKEEQNSMRSSKKTIEEKGWL